MKRIALSMGVLIVLSGCTTVPTPSPSASADLPPVSAQPLRPRAGHTATLLADGRVLLAGGCAVDGCATSEVEPSSELYVPGRGFVPGPPMVHPRSSHTATVLRDGRILIVGGWAKEGTAALTEAEIFDPVTATFKAAGPIQGGAIALPDGRVLIAGDRTGPQNLADVKIFDPATGSFTAGPAMPQQRHAASIVLPDGDILITGGQDQSGHGLTGTFVYNPARGDWRSGPRMNTPRFKHAITRLDDGRVMVLGGTTDDVELLANTEILDLASNTVTPGPMMTTPRFKFPTAVARTTTGRLVVAGGSQVDVLSADGHKFSTISIGTSVRRWTPTATPLHDGTVLVVGGYDERIRIHSDAHIIRV